MKVQAMLSPDQLDQLNAPFDDPRDYGVVSSEYLRDKDVAGRFIQRWRGQSLADTDVLAALGVAKLSEWTKGRAAADDAVNAWLAAKLAQESA